MVKTYQAKLLVVSDKKRRKLELLEQGFKECSRCKEVKQVEEFCKRSSASDGLRSNCRACDKVYHDNYRSDPNNRKRERKTAKKWKQRNREHIRQYQKKWVEENRTHMKELRRDWHLRHKEEENAKARERMKEWVEGNPVRHNINRRNYRARKSEAEGYHTQEQIEILFELCNHRCLVCGETKDLAVDHILSLTKGGTNWIDNLQILCKSHNGEKGNHHNTDYRSQHIKEWAAEQMEVAEWPK